MSLSCCSVEPFRDFRTVSPSGYFSGLGPDCAGYAAPGNQRLFFMVADEMVGLTKPVGYTSFEPLMVIVGYLTSWTQIAVARRRSLSEGVQIALAVHGDSPLGARYPRRFDLCDHARRVRVLMAM